MMKDSMIKDATMKRSTIKEWIKQSTVATAVVKQCLIFLFALSVLSLGWVSASQAAQQVTYYHNNLQGSAIAATNEQGEVVWRESYQPFGKKTKNEAAAADNSPAFPGYV